MKRRLLIEVAVTTVVVLVTIRLWLSLLGSGIDALGGLPAIVIPVLFMWVPVWVMRWQGEDPDRFPLAVPGSGERDVWVRSLRAFAITAAVITPPFVGIYAWWYGDLFPWISTELCHVWRAVCPISHQVRHLSPHWVFPADPLRLVAYHLLFVAPGEELFYRGYVQSRLDQVWAPRWRIAGATLGPGWLVTCAVFALGHSVVAFQWWHFAIFFPALIFGWLRARTGHVVAGALFHAWCNILVAFLDVAWGLQNPALHG